MPRHVDHDGRRSRIVKVTMGLLATGGLRAVTIREVARQLGGSVTLVTHYYPTRSAILDDLASQLIEIWRQEVADIDAGTDEPIERLRQYLAWALPTRAEALRREQARIRLLAERESEPSATATFQAFDATMRWAKGEMVFSTRQKSINRWVEERMQSGGYCDYAARKVKEEEEVTTDNKRSFRRFRNDLLGRMFYVVLGAAALGAVQLISKGAA